ncbi:MAG: zinc/manganese transport system permease protein [Acidimicrobiaceae bacterium]|nr:zinc/manganese transport system permease protein [Acidimicrobiaceae bacterium]
MTAQILAIQGGLAGMFEQPFLQNAFVAGTCIAAACGLVGYFLVLRSQVFTADALSHVAFTGALAALAFGIDLRLGLFVATVGVGLFMGTLEPRGRADDVVVGSVFAWVLGLGALFLTIYTTSRSTGNGTAGVNVLFGSIFGLSQSQAWTAAGVALGIVVVVCIVARPLLFSSIDVDVADARGVPVRLIGFVFLGVVGACAAEATQAVGALLLLGLLAAPAGAAHRLTGRPVVAMVLASALAVGDMWAGLALSYWAPKLPPSFAILAVATAVFLGVLVVTQVRSRQPDHVPD